MPRLKYLGAVALIAAMSALQARAAAPNLPPDSISADTVLVVHLNTAQFNPDQIQAAATAILGPNASKVDEPLKKFKDKYDKAITAGVEAITLVADSTPKADAAAPPADPADPKKDKGTGVLYIRVKPGADIKAIEAMITDEMDADKKDKTVFEQADNFLAVHQKGQTFPVKPDAARAALFSDALGTIGDAAIQVALIPDQTTRDEMLKNADAGPKGLKDAAPLLAKSKWMTLAVSLGNAPGLTGTVNTGAEADAKALSDSLNTALADLKAQIANPGPDAGIMALAGPILAPLLDGLKPTTTGTQVSASIKTDALKSLGTLAATFGLLGPGGPGAAPGAPAP